MSSSVYYGAGGSYKNLCLKNAIVNGIVSCNNHIPLRIDTKDLSTAAAQCFLTKPWLGDNPTVQQRQLQNSNVK